jgi:hypothetical protein
MKKYFLLLCLLLLIVGCTSSIEKPKNLIEKDKMINVLYDLSLLQAIRSQNIGGGIDNKAMNDYIFKKYKIDSVQLAQSNKYYASDMAVYKKIFEGVKAKLEEESKKNGGGVVSSSTAIAPSTPRVQ